MNFKPKSTHFFGNLDPKYLAIATLLFGLVVYHLFIRYFNNSNAYSNSNRFEQQAKLNGSLEIVIPVYVLQNSLTLSQKEIYELRNKALVKSGKILSTPYQLSEAIFSKMADGKPWASWYGIYLYGDPSRMQEGPPSAMLSLANPLLLLEPDFTGISVRGNLKWDFSKVSEERAKEEGFPLHPIPRQISWWPQQKRGEVVYDLSIYLENVNNYTLTRLSATDINFRISNLNALDFGYPWMELSMKESLGLEEPISKDGPKRGFSTLFFFEKGCEKLEGEGCNHLISQNLLPPVKVKELPAVAAYYLWKTEPKNLDAPDFTFQIRMQ